MAENPIKASDLFHDDGVIKELIRQLEQMDRHLKEIGKSYVGLAKEVRQSTDKANVAHKDGQEAIQKNSQEAKALAKANDALRKSQQDVGKELVKLKTHAQENTKVLKEQAKAEHARTAEGRKAKQEMMAYKEETRIANKEAQIQAQLARSAEGSYKQLSAQYQKMKMELNEMSREQRFNTDEGRAMEAQAKAIYNEMNRMQMATGKGQMNVGNYAEAIRQSTMSMKEMQNELRLLQEMSFEGMSDAEIRDVEVAIGELTDRMKKYRYEVEAHGMDTFEMISGSARGAAASVQLVAGSFNMLGIESKALEGVQKNIYSMMAVTTAMQQLEQIYHKGQLRVLATKVRGIGLWVKETAIKKYNAAATWLQVRAQRQQVTTTAASTAATGASATATGIATGATAAWTVAVRAFSKAVYNIPVLGWLLAILGAIIGAVVLLIKHWEKVTDLFRRFGRFLGIVKGDMEDMEDATQRAARAAERMNREYERQERVMKRTVKVRSREIEIMKAMGVEIDKVAEKERALIQTQVDLAKSQLLLAMRMGDTSRIVEMGELIDELEHSLDLHNINERKRRDERLQEEKKAAADRIMAEKKASLQLAVIRAQRQVDEAKGDAERERAALRFREARKDQIRELAEMEMEGLEGAELVLARENMYKELQGIDDEYFKWLFSKEDERFALLRELTQSDEEKRMADLQQTYRERLDLAGEDAELRLAIERWYSDELERIEQERLEQKKSTLMEEADVRMQALQDRLTLEETEFGIIARTDAEKHRFRLEQDLAYYREKLKIAKEFGGYLTDIEIQMVENLIEQTRRKIDEIGEDRPEDFWEMVGIAMKPETKQIIQESTQFALNQVSQIIQARMQQAQAAKQAADEEVAAARQAYDNEMKLLEDGKANRAGAARDELKAAERNQERVAKMEEKERRRQARLEGLAQSGNLLVASTKILAQYGIPMALPFLALMWGTFYAQRREAQKASKEMYGKGHFEVIGGGSHASGRDTRLGIDNKDRRVERGEAFAVFNRKATKKYGQGNLKSMTQAVNDLALERMIQQNILFTKESEGMQATDMRGVEAGIHTLIDQNKERTYRDSMGRLVVKRNNTTRIYV